MRRQREKEEKKREEEERKRANLYWEDLKATPKCVRYGTKEYTAKLANVLQGYDPLKGCLETKGDIHGVKMLPDRCENKVGRSTHTMYCICAFMSVFVGHVGRDVGALDH